MKSRIYMKYGNRHLITGNDDILIVEGLNGIAGVCYQPQTLKLEFKPLKSERERQKKYVNEQKEGLDSLIQPDLINTNQ